MGYNLTVVVELKDSLMLQAIHIRLARETGTSKRQLLQTRNMNYWICQCRSLERLSTSYWLFLCLK